MTFQLKKYPDNPKIEDELLSRNISNMFYLSIYMVFSECIMLISFVGIKDKLPPRYQFIYLGMYVFLLLFALCSALLLYRRKKQSVFNEMERKRLNRYTIFFILIVMLWGVIIALLDQPVYGQLIAFVTNYVFCACLLLIKPRVFMAVQAIPLAVLFLLIPLFQKNSTVMLGHYINLTALLIPLTISSIRSYLFFYDYTANKIKELEFSEKDELTNLNNRRKLNSYIEQELLSGKEAIRSIGILMLDVDYFKKYNDTYGHVQGDAALQAIGTVLNDISRERDVFAARYGGEEFIVIIPNQAYEQVSKTALEIKQRIDKLKIPHKTSKISDVLTVSIGQHYSTESQSGIYDMIKKADEALYEAKLRGRNQIGSV